MGNSISAPSVVGNDVSPPAVTIQTNDIGKMPAIPEPAPATASKCPLGFVSKKSSPSSSASTSTTLYHNSDETKPASSSPSACPVIRKSTASVPPTNSVPLASDSISGSANLNNGASSALCPVISKNNKKDTTKGYVNPELFNVYGEKIDPRNQMPAIANQLPAPGQKQELSTNRVQSNIPKGGTEDSTWLYPSPQMFWNALVRKNKTEGASEEYIETVVSIHNNMNERTWLQVLAWEQFYSMYNRIPGAEPKLLRFTGRPDELSPKAKVMMFFGHEAPFDRHDWMVDRGGVLVRYIIDYYHDEQGTKKDKTPTNLADMHSMQSIKVDVRPALDSPNAFLDRFLFMPIMRVLGRTTYSPLPLFPENFFGRIADSAAVPAPAAVTDPAALEIQNKWADIKTRCAPAKEALALCATDPNEEQCRSSKAVVLQKCTASVVCPDIAAAFTKAVNAVPENMNNIEQSYDAMSNCLDDFAQKSRKLHQKPV